MKRLSEREEAIMHVIWKEKRILTKDIRERLPDPKPHINTVATVLQRLEKKGVLRHEDFGGTYRYAAQISKREYTQKIVKPFLFRMFDHSFKNMVSFFAEEEALSKQELHEIIEKIEEKKR